MQQHPIDNMMQTTMENIRSMVDVNTVVGRARDGHEGNHDHSHFQGDLRFHRRRRRICGR